MAALPDKLCGLCCLLQSLGKHLGSGAVPVTLQMFKYKISNGSKKRSSLCPCRESDLLVPSLGGLSDREGNEISPFIPSPDFKYCSVTLSLYFAYSEEQKQLRAVTATG